MGSTVINPLLEASADGVRLHIKLTPKAAQDKLDRLEQADDGSVRMRVTVTAVPEKGKANAALIKLLSKKLALPKSRIQIIAGEQSRLKTLMISGDSTLLLTDLNGKLQHIGIL
ncbi:UPF0235 protein [Kordiimonas sediminis]|uniref:UPF0235 protein GCM10017044_05380 n=1 Tax=Kordiimonas sediminis TaxID=1735581 RepID=A0A919AME6_9PROT|nr:DUF167 family protein [Kordiimonas sediminis]GHF14210.1 UPF0235 protein [Kordiimonas sediminis]